MHIESDKVRCFILHVQIYFTYFSYRNGFIFHSLVNQYMKLNPLNQRVVEIMKYFELDQTRLANITNVTRQTANGIVLGKAKPGAAFLIDLIIEYKNINARWLLTGEGQMLSRQKSNQNESLEIKSMKDYIHKGIYADLRKDYDNLRKDIDGYKSQIEFFQSFINSEHTAKKKAV